MKSLSFIVVLSFFLTACVPSGAQVVAPIQNTTTPQALPVTNTPTIQTEPTRKPAPTNTLAHTSTPKPTRTPTTEPDWVSNFGRPILNIIANRSPDYTEDFSSISPDWQREIQVCNMLTSRECGISEGVFRISSKVKDQYGVMTIPCFLDFVNFVMSVDIDISELSGENAAGIGYEHLGSEFGFEIKDRGRWSSIIYDPVTQDADTGQVRTQPFQKIIKFMVIVNNKQIAFYLNDTPVTYGEFIAVKNKTNLTLRAWSGGGTAEVEYDNIKIWDLDHIQELQ
jgi:hypothetical protein